MFLMILFDPDHVTINSVPYALDPTFQVAYPLNLGTHHRSKKGCSRIIALIEANESGQEKQRTQWFDGINEIDDDEMSAASATSITDKTFTSPRNTVKESPKVRFAPSAPPDTVSEYYHAGNPVFYDPFLEHRIDNYTNSTSSAASEPISDGAFAHHRDTFWRLFGAERFENEEAENISTLAPNKTALFHRKEMFSHRDTIALLHYKQNLTRALPDQVLGIIAGHLNRRDYQSMRLTCRRWAEHLPHPYISPAQRLPAEILLQIFGLLTLPEYDAARHSCKLWFGVGLDFRLADSMLRCSGIYSSFTHDLERERQAIIDTHNVPALDVSDEDSVEIDDIDHEWLMSKRLATESRLSGSWQGSGLRPGSGHSLTNFIVVENLNFSSITEKMGIQPLGASRCYFTVSACTKYLLVVADRDIVIYRLSGTDTPLSMLYRLNAPRRVLAVSMDTSSGRNAVAALLEGRLGASWDVRLPFSHMATALQTSEPSDLDSSFDFQSWGSVDSSIPTPPMSLPASLTASFQNSNLPYIAQDEAVESLHGTVVYRTESPETAPTGVAKDCERAKAPQTSLGRLRRSSAAIATVPSPTALYADLGTISDTPRSVAICPQRKCVAFGCLGGIELHWVDNTTAASLNRWFPLAAPSDHLFFLPQRSGVDSTKKLRLISSAAGPLQVSGARRNSVTTKLKFKSSNPHHGRLQSMTRLFFGNLPFPSALSRVNSFSRSDNNERQGILRTVDCDHYAAIPLSDGSHVLFTDPATGLLCLGSDAPLGGPTKLMRKVCMIPPASDSPEGATALSCYRSGSEIKWGVRVVAAYDDGRVILYNIPADCFERIRYIRSTPDVWDELAGVVGQSDVLMDVFMASEHDLLGDTRSDTYSNLVRQSSNSSTSKSFRSLQIDGAVIFQSSLEVQDIQVDCHGGGVRVWLFFRDMTALRLSLYASRGSKPRQWCVRTDGTLYGGDKDDQKPSRMQNTEPTAQGKGKNRAMDMVAEPQDDHKRGDNHVKFVLYD